MIRKLFPFFSVLALSALSAAAGESTRPAPARQPLAVVRVTRPDNVERLLDSRLGGMLGVADRDRSGRVPGFNTGPASWRDFFDALTASRAENFWYCLTQGGSFMVGQSAGMGWSWPTGEVGDDSVVDWLQALGFEPEKMNVARRGADLVLARDAATMDEVAGKGPADRQGIWRDKLRAFMLNNPGGVGVWFYPRPVFGVVAIATGVDVRSLATRLGLNAPSSASLDLFPAGDGFGFDLALEGLLNAPAKLSGDTKMMLVPRLDPPEIVRLTFPGLRDHLAVFGLDHNYLFPINMDSRAFLPRTATLTVWRGEDGSFRWNFIALMGDKRKFRHQWTRLVSWVELLSRSRSMPFRTDEVETASGQILRRFEMKGHNAFVGMAETDLMGDDDIMLLAGGSVEDYPDAARIDLHPCDAGVVNWHVRLGPESRMELSEVLADLIAVTGMAAPSPIGLESVFPESEEGGIRFENDGLLLSSPRGMVAWMGPSVGVLAQDWLRRFLSFR